MADDLICHEINLPVGQLRGCLRKTIYDDEYFNFEGIPYGQPPVGNLRFKSPLPAKPWSGLRDCFDFNIKPIQLNTLTGEVEGAEDCLYLNVYAKRLNSAKPLPVIIWIYGGGFTVGEATKTLYSPDYFMKEDVILVTFNYRLCALGFLSLKNPSLEIPGNAGLRDQILALKWVKQYINFFNGDPENITVFGVSAGSVSTHCLTSTPLAKDLFHKAICISGTLLNSWALTPQTDKAYRLAKLYGFKGDNNDENVLAFLQNIEPQKLVKHNILTAKEKRDDMFFAFGPGIEAYVSQDSVIWEEPREMLKTAWGNSIPLIIAGTANEGYIMYPNLKMSPETINSLNDDLEIMLPFEVRGQTEEESLVRAKKLYKAHFGNKIVSSECIKEFLDYYSLRLFWHGFHRSLLSRLSYAKAPTYLYRFAFDSPTFSHKRKKFCGDVFKTGVVHAEDISYLFYSDISWKLDTSSKEYKTIQRMVDIVTTFAKTSNPNCEETKNLTWLPVSSNEPDFALNIGNELSLGVIPEKEKLILWDSIYETNKLY